MTDPIRQKATELIMEAACAMKEGEVSKAQALATEARHLLDEAGIEDAHLRLNHSLLFAKMPLDNVSLIKDSQEALELMEKQNDILGQIDTLFLLVSLLHQEKNHLFADYLNQLEMLLNAATVEEIEAALPNPPLMNGQLFLSLRKGDLEQLRKYIDNPL